MELNDYKVAKFCSQCTPRRANFEWDFDLCQIALDLDRGQSRNFFCYGCPNKAIFKDYAGNLYLSREIKGKLEMKPVMFTDLMN